MNVAEWFKKHKYKASSFSNVKKLVNLKNKQNQTISVIIPTLNEAETIGNIIHVLRSELMERFGLIDEIIVIDSGSRDNTVRIAKEYGASVYEADSILKKYDCLKGRGENLWKGLYVSKGSIVCWLPGDIKNIHPRFVYGLVGPLLNHKKLKFVKAFYKRPLNVGEKLDREGGGRISELLIKPLFNMYFVRLSGFHHPLSNECASYRSVLEKLPFFSGYGVDAALLIDIRNKFGLKVMAQVDLNKRIHRNHNLKHLSKRAFAILQVIIQRANELGKLVLVDGIKRKYSYIPEEGKCSNKLCKMNIEEKQRPPMISIPEYRRKFEKKHE